MAMDEEERLACEIIFGEMDGGEWDYTHMTWQTPPMARGFCPWAGGGGH